MKTMLSDICRGSAKVFFRLEVQDIPRDALVGFSAFTKKGVEVPLMAFPDDGPAPLDGVSGAREFVVAVPLLDCAAFVVTHAFSPQGALLDEDRTTVHPFAAHLGSVMNTALHEAAVRDIRNCDRRKRANRLLAGFKHLFLLKETQLSEGLLLGSATIPQGVSPQVPSLAVYDQDMNEVGHDLCIFPPAVEDAPATSGGPRWRFTFSVRVPAHARTLVIVARDDEGRLLPGFEALDEDKLEILTNRARHGFDAAPGEPSYADWLAYNRPSEDELEAQRLESFAIMPRFSIIVPLYQTPLGFLDELLDSVRSQTYGSWELVLVNASPEDAALGHAVELAVRSDRRIKAIQLEENRGITLNTREGIAVATGDFISFLDHDDTIEPDILFEYAKAINEFPDTDLLYCDEDKLDERGNLCKPTFKPDFSIDMLRNNNFVCHMLTVRASVLRELPTYGAEFDGAQDHNLTLMVSEVARHIHHVPKPLYHWRESPGSTASNPLAKGYANDAGKLAVSSHLERLGIEAEVVDGLNYFKYRVKYAIKGDPKVSIIIPTCDHADLLNACVHSILEKSTYQNYEVILVENNSRQEETFEAYEALKQADPRVSVVTWEGEGFNFSALINFGAAAAQGEYLLLLNNDIEVISPDWIETMLGNCQREEVGAVGALLYYPDHTVQHAGVVLGASLASHVFAYMPHDEVKFLDQRNFSAVTGACLMTPKDLFDQLDGLDEMLAVAFNDIDYCLRVGKAGKLIVFTPYAELYHMESISRGLDSHDSQKFKRFLGEAYAFQNRWSDFYVGVDPYFNPNLDHTAPNVSYHHLRAIDVVS